jgi:multiple sugar transport system permease protein
MYLPKSKLAKAEAVEGFLFIMPWLLGFLIFRLGPMIYSFFLSLNRYRGTGTMEWVGLDNYIYMFTKDPLFRHSLRATTTYVLGYLPLNLIVGFSVALLMNQKVRGIIGFRTIYYLPSVTSGVAVAMLWQFVFHKQYGVLNAILNLVGIQPIGWLVDRQYVMIAFIIMSLWGVGGSMIIYLSGLQSIPTELYEAASIDGANRVQRLFSVTIPMMTPTIFFNLVTGLIGAFQIFANAFIMTGGGPQYATYFFGLNIYFAAFQALRFGRASATAWVLFLIIITLTIFVVSSSRRWVYYAGTR